LADQESIMAKSRSDVAPFPDVSTFMKQPKWADMLSPKAGKKINDALLNTELLKMAAAGFDVRLFMAIGITNAIVARAEAGMQPKSPDPGAWAEWRSKLQTAVALRLDAGGNWGADAANVLRVAFDMGTIAGLLCGAPGISGVASPDQLKASFRAAKLHQTCQVSTASGGGAWCTFDWF
jgi:hypothetical protein